MSELQTFIYPVEDFENKIKSSKTAYLVDSSNFWHNGVHFSAEEEVKNIYELQVVAMRLEKSYEDTYIYNLLTWVYLTFYKHDSLMNVNFEKYFDKQDDGYKLKPDLTDNEKLCAYQVIDELFSNSFVLMKHKVQNSLGKNIEFYSLAQHLKPIDRMTTMQKLKLFWFKSTFSKLKYSCDCVKIKDVSILSDNKNIEAVLVIACETKVDYADTDFNKATSDIEIVWSQNGINYKGTIKKDFLWKYTIGGIVHKEVKRRSRGDEEFNAGKHLKDEDIKVEEKIQIFTTDSVATRQTKAILDKNTKFTITEKDFIDRYPNKSILKVEYIDKNNKKQFGYIYLDSVTADDKEKWEALKVRITGKTEDTIRFSDIEINIKPKKGVCIDSVCVPEDTSVPCGAGIGFAGFSITKEKDENTLDNEDATAIHYEIFCENVDFFNEKIKTNLYEKAKYKINGSFTCLKYQPTTKKEKKRIAMPDCCLLKKEDTYSLVDNETFVKVKIIAKALPVHFFVLRKDLGEWNEAYRAYKGTGKACDTYEERDGNFVKAENGKVLFDSNYPYMYGSEKGDYRKLKYVYEPVDGGESFWVEDSVFTKRFKMLDSKKSYILESKVSENEIYEVKKELAENEEIEMDSGEINVSPKTINKYISSKVVQTWVNINVNGTDYWTDAKNISCEKGFSPIEQIPYNDWKRYFTEIDVQGIDKYKFKESEEHFKKLKFTDVQFEMFKKKKEEDSRNPVPRYRMAHFIKENAEQTDFYYFKNKTEWIADDKLTEMLCKEYPVFKDKLKKQREKYVFFDEARKLRSPGFPQGDTFWYFHPARFINHLDKVVSVPEFNPYEGKIIVVPSSYVKKKNRNTGVERNVGSPGKTMKVIDNPGFAPLHKDNVDQTEYVFNKLSFANITGAFNEDYLDVERGTGNTYREEGRTKFFHEGIDFHGNADYNIVSFIHGEVLGWGWFGSYGRTIFVGHSSGIGVYLLAHLNSYNKDVLNKKIIHPYDIVGTVGGSGNGKDGVYGSHLHVTYFDQEWKNTDIIRASGDALVQGNAYTRKEIRNPFNHKEEY